MPSIITPVETPVRVSRVLACLVEVLLSAYLYDLSLGIEENIC